MKKLAQVTALSALIAPMSSGQAQAATFTEIGDAGETLSAAQVISTGQQPLESICGALSGDADLFQTLVTGGWTFLATTVGGAGFDTQLFLFDSAGMGVYWNDDSFGSSNS